MNELLEAVNKNLFVRVMAGCRMVWSSLLLLWLPIAVPLPTLAAQIVIDLSEIDQCDTCRLPLEKVVSLGEAVGPGMIEEEWTRAVWDDKMGYLTFAFSGTTIKRFDEDGRFLDLIGRAGEGPGEFGAISDVQVVRTDIVALDYRNRSWSVFDGSGAFIRRHRYPYALGHGRFHVSGYDTLVVASLQTRTPDIVGYPLHLTTLASDEPVVHFGADSPTYVPDEPYGGLPVLSTMSRSGTVWWGKPTLPHWEEWSLDGRHLRTVVGDLSWFPGQLADLRRSPRPIPRMGYFGVDAQDRLWIIVEVADPGWREIEFVQMEGGYWEQVGDARPDELRDARLDVFDLKTREHVGHFTWDSVYPALMVLRGDMAVSLVEYGVGQEPQLSIYRLR